MNKNGFFVGRMQGGEYLFTLFEPIRERVFGTSHDNLYIKAGEPYGFRFCDLIFFWLNIEKPSIKRLEWVFFEGEIPKGIFCINRIVDGLKANKESSEGES